MLSVPFYHGLLKKYVIVFGTLFNNLKIMRQGDDGTIQSFKVPINYGPREKFLARVEQNPQAGELSFRLPRLGFEMTNFSYAPDRKLSTIKKIYQEEIINGRKSYKKAYSPVPYDIGFNLYVMTRTTEDATEIVEQILPYFTPEWTVTAALLDDMPDILMDIPLVINGVGSQDNYDSDFKTRHVLIWTLSFTMKAYFYGPISNPKVIKISKIDIYSDLDSEATLERVTVQPGLTANGEPTTRIEETIPHLSIDSDDDYGFVVTIETSPDV